MNIPLQLQKIQLAQTTIELFVPDPAAMQQAYASGSISFPFWSQIWPSAIALSEFINSNPQIIQNKNLLELGAGLGLPSLVASKFAASIVCSDKEQHAVEIISKSAAHNNINNLQASVIDWEAFTYENNVDVLLLSDINYEPAVFEKLEALILQFLKNDTQIVLTTPQRLMAKSFIEPLLKFCTRQEEIPVQHQQETMAITVLVLANS